MGTTRTRSPSRRPGLPVTPCRQTASIPPLVSDPSGNPFGFWSITLYQPDPMEVAAPFLSQASVLNTHYSTADTAVLSVDAGTDTLTVRCAGLGAHRGEHSHLVRRQRRLLRLAAEHRLLRGHHPQTGRRPGDARDDVLLPGLPAVDSDVVARQRPDPGLRRPRTDRRPAAAGAGAGPLTYGLVKPVAQLGSKQLAAGQLATNADGSLTLWFGPSLPAGAPASNWIPTPSTAYFKTIYPQRDGEHDLADHPPHVLSDARQRSALDSAAPIGSTLLPETYIPPVLKQVS